MRFVPIEIQAQAPLAFPERKPGVQFRASLPYVPGTVLYGALGMLLGPQSKHDPEGFARLFRTIRCHNAYSALPGDPWVRPLPLTAIRPKVATLHKKTEGLRYADALYARVCWEQQQPAALIYAPADSNGRAWESAERAFYTLEQADHTPFVDSDPHSARVVTREVAQRVLTRVAINRRRGTAEEGRLYSPLVLSEVMVNRDNALVPTRFLGSIVVPDGNSPIAAALDSIDSIGGRQTSGIGTVVVQPRASAQSSDDAHAIKQRIERMSARFARQAELYRQLSGDAWRDAEGRPIDQPGTIFTINLLADAILLDQGWLPTNELSSEMLAEATKPYDQHGAIPYAGVKARLLRAFTNTHAIGGWNISWQRPKPTAIATTMGSVFVFQAANKLGDQDYQALAQLQNDGIGERRAEGYGQVRICDEFHLVSLEEML